MRSPNRRLTLSAALVMAWVLGPSAAALPARAAPCPASTVAIYSTSPVPHTEAAFETTTAVGRIAAYDLRAGTLHIEHPGGVGSLYVEGADRYRVVGPADGTPIPIVARLEVDGFSQSAGCGGSGCWGEFRAEIGQGTNVVSQSVTTTFAAERKDLVTSLDYPLTVVAGGDFELRCRLTFIRPPGASHFGGGISRLRFVGLPDEARVTSCQGYDSATPTRATSWGRLKALYR
jgi:hypothetical protein